VRGPAEVGELHVVVGGEENVFGLEIAMDDVVEMAVVEGIGDLVCVLGGAMFVEATVLGGLQVTVKFPFAGELESDVDLVVVVEPCEEPEDVGMSEMKWDVSVI
jgi:hypothetical protein